MNECKKCIYHESYLNNIGDYGEHPKMVEIHVCRVYPKIEEVDGRGCGQFSMVVENHD